MVAAEAKEQGTKLVTIYQTSSRRVVAYSYQCWPNIWGGVQRFYWLVDAIGTAPERFERGREIFQTNELLTRKVRHQGLKLNRKGWESLQSHKTYSTWLRNKSTTDNRFFRRWSPLLCAVIKIRGGRKL